ncbi:serrate RNA effector molecule homolog [Artemia franciscana]|uniref:Uncharacterized protein n=1 Tax=Artemia franciscana TaxID=6661 RepID=A0AA88LFR4_ARTSF|nr:hypothetical protein QYM36_001484 [Artemia franciscana]
MKLVLLLAIIGFACARPKPNPLPEDAAAEPASLQQQPAVPKGPGGKRKITSFLRPGTAATAAGKAEEPHMHEAKQLKTEEHHNHDVDHATTSSEAVNQAPSSDVINKKSTNVEEAQAEPASLQQQPAVPKGPGGKRKVTSFLRPGATEKAGEKPQEPHIHDEKQLENEEHRTNDESQAAATNGVAIQAASLDAIEKSSTNAEEAQAEPASLVPQAPAKKIGGKRKITSFARPSNA